jgi:hypothetical protein
MTMRKGDTRIETCIIQDKMETYEVMLMLVGTVWVISFVKPAGPYMQLKEEEKSKLMMAIWRMSMKYFLQEKDLR